MPASARTAQPTSREAEILEVAAGHLNTMGVSVEWFSEIATSLGLTRPALYKYVVDREDLLFRCYQQSCDALDTRLREARRAHSKPVDILCAFLTGPKGDAGETAVMSEMMALHPAQREIIWARQHRLAAELAALVAEGVSAKAFRKVDAAITASAVLGMASWPLLYGRWGGGVNLDLVAEGSRELLLYGLAADRQAPHARPGRLVALDAPRPDIFDRAAVDAAKRHGVLVAASALFNSRGIGATRVEDVGAAVGLSKRAIYHHVGQKQVLIDACVERAYAYFLAVMDAGEALPTDRLAALYACVRDVVRAARDPEVSIMTPYVGYGQLSPEERRRVTGHNQLMSAGYRRMLDQGIREGSLRPMPVEAVLVSMPGVFSWAANAPVDAAAGLRDAEALAELITRGILS